MNHRETLQAVLDYIDDNITNEISVSLIAKKAGYSTHHFNRIFTGAIGTTDHGWYFGGKLQIDICIPIRQKKEEMQKSQLRANR